MATGWSSDDEDQSRSLPRPLRPQPETTHEVPDNSDLLQAAEGHQFDNAPGIHWVPKYKTYYTKAMRDLGVVQKRPLRVAHPFGGTDSPSIGLQANYIHCIWIRI